MHRVRMMKHFGVTPYLVFDGDFLPSKAATEASRAKRREETRKAGLELLKAGKPSQAHQELQKSIDVTPEMARHLIEDLKEAGIPYVVAPYEADAQMVYLERQGLVTGIVSEDSDLLVFGAKRLLTKLDQHGECVEINRRDFCACREVSLTGWTDAEFRQMAILSGCDYLQGIGNMGLKTAYRMIRKYKTPERVIRMVQFDGKFKVSENYLAAFKQAELTFLHQRVFCPKQQELVLLSAPDSGLDVEGMPFIGAKVPPELARAVAVGDVNPITKERIVIASMPRKRMASHPSATPAANQSRQAVKPIDSYFKGHRRIPMGEMDPNCFAVEPRRVAALTQNGLTPRVFPLPRPYLESPTGLQSTSVSRPYVTAPTLRRRTEPIGNLLNLSRTGSNLTRRRTEGSVSTADEIGTGLPSRPPKKARLCHGIEAEESERTQGERSKFFPAPKSSTLKARKQDPVIMSDDSIEEAMLSLPDLDEWHSAKSTKPVPMLQIFQDCTEPPVATDTSTAQGDAKGDEGQVPDTVEVLASSPPASLGNAVGVTVLSQTPARPALQQFSYTPKPAAGAVRMAYGLPTPVSSAHEPTSNQPARQPIDTPTPLQTPLQRMGANALKRHVGSARAASSASKAAGSMQEPKSPRTPLASLPVNPAFVPLPRVELDEVEALNRPLGSEDQIIPDSDGENEAELDVDEKRPSPARRLDLSRFVYS